MVVAFGDSSRDFIRSGDGREDEGGACARKSKVFRAASGMEALELGKGKEVRREVLAAHKANISPL